MIVKFLFLTLSISWILWLPGIIQTSNRSLFPQDLVMIIGMLGTAVPSIVGAVMMKKGLKKLFRFKINIYSLCSILIIPVLLIITHFLNATLLGGNPPEIKTPHLIPLQFIMTLLILGPLNEEIGWRGFLHDNLTKRFPSVITGFIIGVVWTVWHIPAFFIDVMHFSDLPFMQFLSTLILSSILISFLQTRCRCGIWPGLIIHTLINLGMEVAPLMNEKSYTPWIIANILLAITTLIIILLEFKELKRSK